MNLLEYINEKFPEVDDSGTEILKNETYTKDFSLNELVLEKGRKCDFVGFVISGSFRTFHLTKKGTEQTLYLALENDWITSYFSYLTETGSDVYIQSLEKSRLEFLPRKALNQLYEKSATANMIGRKIAETIYIEEYQRNKDLLNLDAAAHYKKLFVQRPEVVKRIKLQYIASFLGITKESLSRVRKEIT